MRNGPASGGPGPNSTPAKLTRELASGAAIGGHHFVVETRNGHKTTKEMKKEVAVTGLAMECMKGGLGGSEQGKGTTRTNY